MRGKASIDPRVSGHRLNEQEATEATQSEGPAVPSVAARSGIRGRAGLRADGGWSLLAVAGQGGLPGIQTRRGTGVSVGDAPRRTGRGGLDRLAGSQWDELRISRSAHSRREPAFRRY